MKRELQGCCIKERIEEGDLEDLFIFQKKKKKEIKSCRHIKDPSRSLMP